MTGQRDAVTAVRDLAAARLRDEAADTTTGHDPEAIREHARHIITQAVHDYADGLTFTGQPGLDPAAEADIAIAVWDEIYGLGRLQPLLDDPGTETVDVNGCDEVWVNRADGTKIKADPVADTDEQLIEMVRRWGAWQGSTARDFSEARPRMQLSLRGGYRLGAVMRVTPGPASASAATGCSTPTWTCSPPTAPSPPKPPRSWQPPSGHARTS